MKTKQKLALGALAASLSLFAAGCGDREEAAPEESGEPSDAQAAATPALETVDQRVSYGIAYNIGGNIARQGGMDLDEEAFLAGLKDGLERTEPQVSESDLQAAFAEAQSRAEAEASEAATANVAAGETYLAENAAKPGVVTTDSGLQYEVLESGDGPSPSASDTVEVHYHGTLTNGTVFDSSVQRGEPISFAVNGVIRGWTEALQLMSVGDKWSLTIPPDLAYGNRPTGSIPPGSVLVFEVELLGIN